MPGLPIMETITNIIDKAAKDGYVLYLIDYNKRSEFVDMEIMYALHLSAHILPILVAGEELDPIVNFLLPHKPIIDVRNLPQDEQVCRIVQHLVDYDLQFNEE